MRRAEKGPLVSVSEVEPSKSTNDPATDPRRAVGRFENLDATANKKKPVQRATLPPEQRLLVDRRDAAQYLSISQRSLDYLVANGELNVRKIGARVLIPISELQRYAQVDHKRLVG